MSDQPELYSLRSTVAGGVIYLHGADVVASLRGRQVEFARMAEEAEDETLAGVWWGIAEAFRVHADQMDVAAIEHVTEVRT